MHLGASFYTITAALTQKKKLSTKNVYARFPPAGSPEGAPHGLQHMLQRMNRETIICYKKKSRRKRMFSVLWCIYSQTVFRDIEELFCTVIWYSLGLMFPDTPQDVLYTGGQIFAEILHRSLMQEMNILKFFLCVLRCNTDVSIYIFFTSYKLLSKLFSYSLY